MIDRKIVRAVLALFVAGYMALCGAQRVMANSISLTLESTGGNSAAGYYIYPYYFSVNGSQALTPLMCLSFNNEITFGESWTATTAPVTGSTLDEEAAWLLNDANANPGNTPADQLAAWALFANNVPSNSDETTQLNLAAGFVAADPVDPTFYRDFTLYIPVDGTQSWGGYPQIFIGETGRPLFSTETPEPSSLFLFLSGLVGFVTSRFRRRNLL